MKQRLRTKLNYTQIVAYSFLGIIILGTILLSMPFAVNKGVDVSLLDTLFTSASAASVTCMTVADSLSTWSVFGQIVILVLIQVGSLGIMTLITGLFTFRKRKISLRERNLLMQSAGTMRLNGVVSLIRRIVTGTFAFEAVGAVVIAAALYPQFDLWHSLYYGMFYSVSAFCNAGFDLTGCFGSFGGVLSEADIAVINITVTFLIITGGLGYIVWEDISKNKFAFEKYSLHSKILISFNALLIAGGGVLFFIFEYSHTLSDFTLEEKIYASFFQSVSLRTAGFNFLDLSRLSSNGKLLSILLMFIGGGSGSTAGGIKVTTFAVLVLSMLGGIRCRDKVSVFRRSLSDDAVRQAEVVLLVYGFMVIVSFFIMGCVESFSAGQLLFEAVSAVSTTGMTLGITRGLSALSKIVIMILMFGGKIGGLAFMVLFMEKRIAVGLNRPSEKIIIG
ncbi:MAG: Trk family potassium uptake protein [Clostridia bacterium]|nr:Trk family potassium uptake protein [Clostridia bacterium]